jgi:hypothetical protein
MAHNDAINEMCFSKAKHLFRATVFIDQTYSMLAFLMRINVTIILKTLKLLTNRLPIN